MTAAMVISKKKELSNYLEQMGYETWRECEGSTYWVKTYRMGEADTCVDFEIGVKAAGSGAVPVINRYEIKYCLERDRDSGMKRALLIEGAYWRFKEDLGKLKKLGVPFV